MDAAPPRVAAPGVSGSAGRGEPGRDDRRNVRMRLPIAVAPARRPHHGGAGFRALASPRSGTRPECDPRYCEVPTRRASMPGFTYRRCAERRVRQVTYRSEWTGNDMHLAVTAPLSRCLTKQRESSSVARDKGHGVSVLAGASRRATYHVAVEIVKPLYSVTGSMPVSSLWRGRKHGSATPAGASSQRPATNGKPVERLGRKAPRLQRASRAMPVEPPNGLDWEKHQDA